MLGRKFKKVQTFLTTRFAKKSSDATSNPENHSDDSNYSPLLNVYISTTQRPVARIVLNGYNIEEGMPHSLGVMRSFKVVQGDLWQQWNEQKVVTLSDDNGQDALIKVAALPVDDDSFGLIEFLQPVE